MLKVFVALCLLSGVASQLAGGENIPVPAALSPVPYDKCSVAGANDADMRMTLFAWGYNNEFWYSKQGEDWGPFGEWKSAGGFFVGGPTVVRNANDDIVVFGRGALDRKVYYKVFHNGQHEDDMWMSLGGKVAGRVTATIDSQGLLHVFARGKDSAVWEKRQYANGTEAVWGEWTSLGGIVTSDVAAVADGEAVTHLFARGVDGSLWRMSQKIEDDSSLTWVAWEKSENSVYLSSSSTIVARLNTQNLVEVFARGADKAFWYTRQTTDETGVVWSPWKSLGGIFSSAPAVRMNSDSYLTVFGRGPEKGLWYKQQAHHPVDFDSDAWSKWVPLGGRFSSGIDAIPDSRGFINVFGRGLDKSIWFRGQMYSNRTVGFTGPWYNIGGRFRPFGC